MSLIHHKYTLSERGTHIDSHHYKQYSQYALGYHKHRLSLCRHIESRHIQCIQYEPDYHKHMLSERSTHIESRHIQCIQYEPDYHKHMLSERSTHIESHHYKQYSQYALGYHKHRLSLRRHIESYSNILAKYNVLRMHRGHKYMSRCDVIHETHSHINENSPCISKIQYQYLNYLKGKLQPYNHI